MAGRELVAVINMYLLHFTAYIPIIFLPPLLPNLALGKGMAIWVLTLAAGLMVLIGGISSYLSIPLIEKFGCKVSFVVCTTGFAVCGLLFGLVEFCPSGWFFDFSIYFLSVVTGLFSGPSTAIGLVVLIILMPKRISTVYGLMAFVISASTIIAPALSSFIKERTSFYVPFLIFGSVGIIHSLVMIFILPKNLEVATKTEADESKKSQTGILDGLRSLCTHVQFIVLLIILFFLAGGYGFTINILQVYLTKEFQLNATIVGLMFSTQAVGTIFAPGFGYLCDKFSIFHQFEVTGLLLFGSALIMIGPSPYLKFGHPKVWLTCFGLFLQGLAVGIFAPAICGHLIDVQQTISPGDSVLQELTISTGFLINCLALFFGNVAGGLLYNSVGFLRSATACGFFEYFIALIFIIYLLVKFFIRRKRHASYENLNSK